MRAETKNAMDVKEQALVSWWRGEEERAKRAPALPSIPSPTPTKPATTATASSSSAALLLAARGGHWCKLQKDDEDADNALIRAVYAASVLLGSESSEEAPQPPSPGCFDCVVARREAAAAVAATVAAAALPASSSSSPRFSAAIAADAARLSTVLTGAADAAGENKGGSSELSCEASAAVFETISYPEPLLLPSDPQSGGSQSRLERALSRLLLLLGDALDLGASRYSGSYFLLCSGDSRTRGRARRATAAAGAIETAEDAAAAGAGLRRAAGAVLSCPPPLSSSSPAAAPPSPTDAWLAVKHVFGLVRTREAAAACLSEAAAVGGAEPRPPSRQPATLFEAAISSVERGLLSLSSPSSPSSSSSFEATWASAAAAAAILSSFFLPSEEGEEGDEGGGERTRSRQRELFWQTAAPALNPRRASAVRSLVAAAAKRTSTPSLAGSSEEARLHSHLLPLLSALGDSLSGLKETTPALAPAGAGAAAAAAAAAAANGSSNRRLLPPQWRRSFEPATPGAASVARSLARFLAAAALSNEGGPLSSPSPHPLLLHPQPQPVFSLFEGQREQLA